jgi:hypothetical protein
MTTVQLAIKDKSLAQALSDILTAEDGFAVLNVDRPNSSIAGPILVDDFLLTQLTEFEAGRLVVLTSHKDVPYLSVLWEQGVRNVVFTDSPPEIARLAIVSAFLRIKAARQRQCFILHGEGVSLQGNGLEGPFALTDRVIDEVILEQSPGAFVLERTNNGVHSVFVGRSDFDVNNQLHVYVGAYTRFKFVYCSSPQAAFEKECTLFHDFDPTDGIGHPLRPPGSKWTCPRCKLLG